jgi:hypothetical protein
MCSNPHSSVKPLARKTPEISRDPPSPLPTNRALAERHGHGSGAAAGATSKSTATETFLS